MNGLILAAGRGSRLTGVVQPKCLCAVGAHSLIELQLDALARAGINAVTVIVGYEGRQVVDAVGARVSYLHNSRFASTDSLYTFLQAEGHLHGDVVVLNSDVLFPLQLLERLLELDCSALAYDSSSGHDPEQMSVELRADGRHLKRLDKRLSRGRTHGENVGLMVVRQHVLGDVFAAARAIVRRGGAQSWFPAAISAIADEHDFRCVDAADLPWTEVDVPEDLARARREVWPCIRELEATRCGIGGVVRSGSSTSGGE